MGSPTPGADQTNSDVSPREEMPVGVIPLAVDVASDRSSDSNSNNPNMTVESALISTPKHMRNFFVQNVKVEHLIAGISGGAVATLMVHPLDLIKVRFQSGASIPRPKLLKNHTLAIILQDQHRQYLGLTDVVSLWKFKGIKGFYKVNEGHAQANPKVSRPQYHGMLHAFRSIAKSDGLAGLYAGISPNLVGAGAAWGLYFLFYNAAKNYVKGDSNRFLSWSEHMGCACQSGVLTLAMTNPIWVTKTRLCLQYERLRLKKLGQAPASSGVPGADYRGMTDALAKIWRSEGIRGLYKGFVPGLFGVSHGVLQFMSYEEMKKQYNLYRGKTHDARLSSVEYLIFAALSKSVAAFTTYPYQVMRTRLQDQHRQYRGLTDVVVSLWRFEGIKGFYKGLLPSLIRVVPATMITFLVYENVSHFLLERSS